MRTHTAEFSLDDRFKHRYSGILAQTWFDRSLANRKVFIYLNLNSDHSPQLRSLSLTRRYSYCPRRLQASCAAHPAVAKDFGTDATLGESRTKFRCHRCGLRGAKRRQLSSANAGGCCAHRAHRSSRPQRPHIRSGTQCGRWPASIRLRARWRRLCSSCVNGMAAVPQEPLSAPQRGDLVAAFYPSRGLARTTVSGSRTSSKPRSRSAATVKTRLRPLKEDSRTLYARRR